MGLDQTCATADRLLKSRSHYLGEPMVSTLAARVQVCVTALVAVVALAGKALHNPYMQGWNPHAVSMKEATAWMILQHCWSAFIISRPAREATDPPVYSLPVYFISGITLLMGCGLILEIFHSQSELAGFDPQKSFFPSVMTVAALCLLALKSFSALLFHATRLTRALSWMVALIGLSVIAGYAANLPKLYFFIPGYTTAMAINTAFCFLFLGLVSVRSVHK